MLMKRMVGTSAMCLQEVELSYKPTIILQSVIVAPGKNYLALSSAGLANGQRVATRSNSKLLEVTLVSDRSFEQSTSLVTCD